MKIKLQLCTAFLFQALPILAFVLIGHIAALPSVSVVAMALRVQADAMFTLTAGRVETVI